MNEEVQQEKAEKASARAAASRREFEMMQGEISEFENCSDSKLRLRRVEITMLLKLDRHSVRVIIITLAMGDTTTIIAEVLEAPNRGVTTTTTVAVAESTIIEEDITEITMEVLPTMLNKTGR